MAAAETGEAFSSAVTAITMWGGLPPLAPHACEAVRQSLPALDLLAPTGVAPEDDVYARRVAAVSKVYAMHDLGRWVIYDSRVARALAKLVSEWQAASDIHVDGLRFPQPAGRNNLPPPPGFPRVSNNAPTQPRRAFVYASWLAQDIAGRIADDCPDRAVWDARHVEMVWFMIGGRSQRKESTMPGPVAARGVMAAKGAAQRAAGSELVQRTAQDQILSQIDKRQAKARAVRFAQQTGSTLALVQFQDGPQRWTVFKKDRPIASFPPYPGDLAAALADHELDRLRMRDPDDVRKELEADKGDRRLRLPGRRRKEDPLELNAGDELDADVVDADAVDLDEEEAG